MKIYTSDSQLRSPLKLIKDMFYDVMDSKELAWRLMVRNISALYRQSIFGIAWAFILPLLTTFVWVFLNSSGLVKMEKTPIPYAVFTFTGTLFWQIFVDALNSPIREIARSRSMLTKINFPREALILSGFGEVLFNAYIRLLLIVPLLITFNINPGLFSLFTVIGVLVLVLAGISIGLFFTPIGTLYLDIGRGLTLITTFWMYITPVVFPMKTDGLAGIIFKYNPMTYLILTVRDSITGQPLLYLQEFVLVFIGVLFLLFFSWILFRISMPHLISRMGG